MDIQVKCSLYSAFGKRWFDLVLTILGLMLVSPVIGAIALLVKLKMGGPVIFRQVRPGHYGKPFTIYKFRSMTDELDEKGCLLPEALRLNPLGRFLRAGSLDELPELWNVLKGEMSLVGPRPLLMQYLDRYSPEQARRHEVKPGLTGWAQVNGRNSVKFSERLKLDVWYVDNFSMILDLNIIFRTFLCVLKRENVRNDFETCLTEVDDCGFHISSTNDINDKSDIKELL